MANTALPTSVAGGDAAHVAHHNIIHAELNAMSQDTGWRVPVLQNGWKVGSAGFVRCRREGNLVFWQFAYLDGTEASSTILVPMSGNPPAGSNTVGRGLAPRYNSRYWFNTPEGTPFSIFFSQTGLYISNPTAHTGQLAVYEIVAHADLAWPANLPPAQ